MGDDNPPNRLAGQRPLHHFRPDTTCLARIETSIDHSPAVTIIQCVYINMIQTHRQRQPKPQHPVSHLCRSSMFRHVFPGVTQARWLSRHVVYPFMRSCFASSVTCAALSERTLRTKRMSGDPIQKVTAAAVEKPGALTKPPLAPLSTSVHATNSSTLSANRSSAPACACTNRLACSGNSR